MGAKTRILILDDEPIVPRRLKPSLEKKGYEVEGITDSRKALDRVSERTFDIVITDLKMEGYDGMAFLEAVKAISPETQVVMITGFATMDTARESFRRGVADFIAKPFQIGEIVEVIEKAEARRKGHRG